jgi:hypothetical protein
MRALVLSVHAPGRVAMKDSVCRESACRLPAAWDHLSGFSATLASDRRACLIPLAGSWVTAAVLDPAACAAGVRRELDASRVVCVSFR